jgi:drug/metabolite transporter (DMT)-like permease
MRGRLLVLAAAVLWSTSGFFAKAPLFDQWPLEQRGVLLAFWRALFASLLLIPLVRRPRWHVGVVPMVLCFAAMNYTYLTAMTWTTAANAIWLQNVAPVWVFLVGVFLFGEHIQRGDWLLVLCGALGVGFILFHEARGEQLAGVICGLLSGVFFAGVVLCVRQLRGEDAAWLITLNLTVTAAVLLPIALVQGSWPTGRQFAYLTAFGMFQLGLPYLLFARGVRSISGHEASGIALLEPMLVPVWVFLAWHQEPSYQPPRWWTYVGGTLILLGLGLRYAGARRPARRRNGGPARPPFHADESIDQTNPPGVDCSSPSTD